MDENKIEKRSAIIKKIVSIIAFIVAMAFIVSIPVAAWFMTQKQLAAYAPISSPQSLYIGAGHIEFAGVDSATVDKYEDIRYLYLEGIDADEGKDYYDYVFCVYGKAISGFKIQLAYTTNNQFTYQIYNATESNVTSAGAVAYTTHDVTPTTYYYSVNGEAIAGSFLNDSNSDGIANAEGVYHVYTYGEYTDVNKYAEPLYWQTTGVIQGTNKSEFDGTKNFVRYFILRVNLNGKNKNDRETDVICIAAKLFTYEG